MSLVSIMNRTLTVAFVLCLAVVGQAQTNECDAFFKPVCSDINGIIATSPNLGVSIATMKDGHLSYATFNKTPEGEPIQHDMPFEVGSITKTFTGARTLQLVKSGRVTLDTSIGKVIPPDQIFYTGNLPSNVTVRQLLDFTAGLDDYVVSYVAIAGNLAAFWPLRNMTSAGFYTQAPYTGAPCYTSTNSLLLGLMIDGFAGGNGLTKAPLVKSYHENLFKPAGLSATTLGGYEERKPISSCTNTNYLPGIPPTFCPNSTLPRYTGDAMRPNDSQTAYLSFAGTAGGIISTSGDIARWFNWLFKTGPGEQMVSDPQLLGERAVSDTHPIMWYKCGSPTLPWPYPNPRLVKMSVGYDMEISTLQYADKKVIVYSFLGGTLSFNGYGFYLPEYDRSFAVLVNNFTFPATVPTTPESKLNSTATVYDIAYRLIDYVVQGK